jgi:hypothetical protein
MSSTLPNPRVATFRVPGFALASFSKSAQDLKRLFSATSRKDGPSISRATGMMSVIFQLAGEVASTAWELAM